MVFAADIFHGEGYATAESQYRAAGLTNFASLYQALEENSSDITHISSIPAWGEHTVNVLAIAFGRALTDNTVVQLFEVNVDQMTLAGANALTPFIASSPSLSYVQILYPNQPRQPAWRQLTTIAVANALLDAIASNGRIQTLYLPAVFDAFSLAGCLRGMRSSLVNLELDATLAASSQTPRTKTRYCWGRLSTLWIPSKFWI